MSVKKNWIDKICYVILFSLFIILGVRAFYGFDSTDESFYIASVNRLYLGDMLLRDEWHYGTLFTVLLLPVHWLYRTIVGNTDGIILFYRLLYVIVSYIVSIYMYQILKRYYSQIVACIGAVLYFLYTKQSIASFSYNTLSICSMMMCFLFVVQGWYSNEFRRKA